MLLDPAWRLLALLLWPTLACLLLHPLAWVVAPARAHENEWFRSLLVPGTASSCCHDKDCIFTDDWRATAAGFEVRLDGRWIAVPPDRVLDRRDGPARATVCHQGGRVICFVPGVMT